MDLKYDIMKHSDVRMTSDGHMGQYFHGEPWDAAYTLSLIFDSDDIAVANSMKELIEITESEYVLLSEEDVEMDVKQLGSQSFLF